MSEATVPPLPTSAPMEPSGAAAFFRHLVETRALRLSYTLHAKRRLRERGISGEGVLHLLARGDVPKKPRRVDGLGRSKYWIEGVVTTEGTRKARLVVLAAPRNPMLRVLTVMWVDEPPDGLP